MSRFSTSNRLGGTEQALSTTAKTLINIFGSGSNHRAQVYSLFMGTDGTPSNDAALYDVIRMTVDGTGTAVTPSPLDLADTACLLTSKANYTAEPTTATVLKAFPLNVQASYRWTAWDQDDQLIMPATTAAGICLRAKALTYVGTAVGEMNFEE